MTTQSTTHPREQTRTADPDGRHPWAEPFVFTDRLAEVLDLVRDAVTPHGSKFPPGAELSESDDVYTLDMDLPRVSRADVSVVVSDRRVDVRGTWPEPDRPGLLRHSSRPVGEFAYEVHLPGGVDPHRATARLRDGILTVSLPRTEGAPGRALAVE